MKVNCPQCKKEVIWGPESPHRPFCSKRCQLIDLGEWSEEQHVIQGNSQSQNNKPTDIDIEEIEAMLAKQNNDFFQS